LTLSSCAAPPVTLYALGASGVRGAVVPLRPGSVVIEVARVTLPDYLDTQDILVRRGSALETSHTGRWASRLSLGATELLAGILAQTRPEALVTDQPQTAAPAYRLSINISRLDVTTEQAGRATLDADWLIVPRDPALPARRDRIRLSADGPVATDQAVVTLETTLLTRLAHAIDITRLR